jgi:hypothetical protein
MLVTAPWVRPGAYPRVDHLKGSLTTIRLGWKGLPGTNTLAYHKNSIILDVKSLITFGGGVNAIDLSSSSPAR